MPYTAEISRNNPTCFLFLVDQSGSMSDRYSDNGLQIAQAVADALNKLLQDLVIKCAKSEGIRDYFHVGVIGYGEKVGAALNGTSNDNVLVPISFVAENPKRIEERTKKEPDGAGGIFERTVKFPIWFDPSASGGTPMREAFELANKVIANWLYEHPDCFPPTVIHITDGEANIDPSAEMHKLVTQESADGQILLFNLHTAAQQGQQQRIFFPNSSANLPSSYAELLYGTASYLTTNMLAEAQANTPDGFSIQAGAKGYVMNGDLEMIIRALEIGTRPSNLR